MTLTVAIKSYGGKSVNVLGLCIIYLHTAQKILKVHCQVTDTDGYFLLEKEDAKSLGYNTIHLSNCCQSTLTSKQ